MTNMLNKKVNMEFKNVVKDGLLFIKMYALYKTMLQYLYCYFLLQNQYG